MQLDNVSCLTAKASFLPDLSVARAIAIDFNCERNHQSILKQAIPAELQILKRKAF